MAGFKMHVSTSSLCGVAYAGTGFAMGIPWDSALVAGSLCGVSGMLPDLDSGSGRPLRETMGFAAAVIPMLLVDRFQQLGLSYEQLVLATVGLYLLIRYGVAKLLAKYTVHRGMFHSIPAALTFAGVAFLLCGCTDLQLRYFKAGAVLLGVMSHLVLDEIYSIQFQGIRGIRLKSSSGTAIKFWGSSMWANFSAYGKLALVTLLILGDPLVMTRYGEITPWAIKHAAWNKHEEALRGQEQLNSTNSNGSFIEGGSQAAGFFTNPLPASNWDTANQLLGGQPENLLQAQSYEPSSQPAAKDHTIYDTADRLWNSVQTWGKR